MTTMKKFGVGIVALLILCLCGLFLVRFFSPIQSLTPAAPPAATPDTLLGDRSRLIRHFENEYNFAQCGGSGNHVACLSPDGLVTVAFYDDPVTKALINIPLDAAGSKPSKYATALLIQTGLTSEDWDWLVSQMEKPEASRVFGDRRITSKMDNEKWLVTVEIVR